MEHFPVPEYARANPDEDHGGLLIRSAIVMACLSTTAVALRFLSRKLTKVPLLTDDWIILAALPFTLTLCAIDIYGPTNNHFGRHLQFSTPDTLRRFFQATFTFEIAYNFGITLPKFSMLALYARVFGFSAFKWPLIGTASITTIFFLACTFTAIFACNPISDYWNNPAGATCLDHINYYIGQAVANIILDIMLMLLPIIPIRRLQMTSSQKIAVSAIFFIGIFVTICSGLRLERLVNTKGTTAVDPTFALVDAALWSVIETNLAVVCACLPSMRPLLRALLHGRLRSNSAGSAAYYNNNSSAGGALSRQSTNRRSALFNDPTVAANQKRRSQALAAAQAQAQGGGAGAGARAVGAFGGISKEQHTAVTSAEGSGSEVELGYYATVTAQHDNHARGYRKESREESRSVASSSRASSRTRKVLKWGWSRSKERAHRQQEREQQQQQQQQRQEQEQSTAGYPRRETSWAAKTSSESERGEGRSQQPGSWPLGNVKF